VCKRIEVYYHLVDVGELLSYYNMYNVRNARLTTRFLRGELIYIYILCVCVFISFLSVISGDARRFVIGVTAADCIYRVIHQACAPPPTPFDGSTIYFYSNILIFRIFKYKLS